jgi:putative endonuclease
LAGGRVSVLPPPPAFAKASAGAPVHALAAKAARRSFSEGGPIMKYVYLLRSLAFPEQRYIGLTSSLKSRLRAHNAGQSIHTAKYKPWQLVAYFAFKDEGKAASFEKYLKSGSGRAFANSHLW